MHGKPGRQYWQLYKRKIPVVDTGKFQNDLGSLVCANIIKITCLTFKKRKMEKWEYATKVSVSLSADFWDDLIKMGMAGWEMFAVVCNESGFLIHYFKRPII